MHGYTFFISPSPLPPAKLLRDSAIITWREGDWEMCEIRPKTKSYSPLIKQKLISTPPAPSHNDNIKFNPPLEKSLLPLIPSYLVYLLDFFLRYKHHFKSNDSSTYVEESSESLDSELVSSSHELGDSSSSTASLAVRFPHACVIENSINQLSLASTYLKTFLL